MLFKKIILVTHSGDFHADDLFAVATLQIALRNQAKIIRTRDPKWFEKADYVLDVGRVYDPVKHRYDHHQPGGAGVRENGIPYAAFGLVWKEFGSKICGDAKIAERLDSRLVAPLDAHDNGVSVFDVKSDTKPYLLEYLFYAFSPNWKEGKKKIDHTFFKLLPLARKLLLREIQNEKVNLEAEGRIRKIYESTEDKRVLILDNEYFWQPVVDAFPEVQYVIAPKLEEHTWNLYAVRIPNKGFELKKPLPEQWAGKRDGELAEVTGIADVVFCHNKRFLFVVRSKESALQLAEIALKS